MKKTVFGYIFSFLFGWFALCVILAFVAGSRTLDQPHSLSRKLQDYRSASAEYNLLFLGDSRTYCGFHPELIDPLLGAKSLNLATWANWLPSQYLFVKDLIPEIPQGTTVVWTLGRSNFSWNSFRDKYPLNFTDAVLFYRLGLSVSDIQMAWLSRNPFFMFPLKSSSVYERIEGVLNRPLWESEGFAHASTSQIDGADAVGRDLNDLPPDAVFAIQSKNVLFSSGKPTSVEYKSQKGGYCRYELDKEFFRNKETMEEISPVQADAFVPEDPLPSMEFLLGEVLKEFHVAGVHLVINVIEDSPYTYGRSAIVREKWSRHLLEYLEKQAAPYGFEVLDIDYSQITDEDYFDHNHLNYDGAVKLAARFAEAIKPHLP